MERHMMERRSQLMVVGARLVNHMAMMGTPSSLGQAVVSYRVYRVVGPLPLDQIAVNCLQAAHYMAWERHIGYRRLLLEEDSRHKNYNS
jgi:hypothetical protein